MENQPQASKPCPKQKLFMANAALLVYFLLPNTTSLLLVLALAALYCFPETQSHCCCDQECKCSVNSSFNNYLEMPNSKKVLVVLLAGLAAQVAYYLPSWLLVFLAVELWAGWSFLVELGVVELLQTQISSADASFHKLLDMIPRYKGQ